MQSNLYWPGTGILQAARNAIRAGERVEIQLPLEVHYALHRHLHPGAAPGPVERLEADGGAELLRSVATVAGLEELKQLGAAVRRAHYTVRVTSPEPRLMLLPPEHEQAPRRR
jgi:hypothetical protein